MSFVPSTFAALNFAMFAGIAVATMFAGVGDNVWTVALAILGTVVNALAWCNFSNSESAFDNGKEPMPSRLLGNWWTRGVPHGKQILVPAAALCYFQANRV